MQNVATAKFFRPLNKIPEDMSSGDALNFSYDSHILVWINSWQQDNQVISQPLL